MKKFLVNWWPVILLLLLVASCGKEKSREEDLSQYFIKCKIGGVDKTFNVNAAATKADLGSGALSYSIFGKSVNDPANFASLGFDMKISIPFATGTYKETDPTTDYFLTGVYNPNTTDGAGIYVSQKDETIPFQVTFTQISETTLAGTFKGKLHINKTDPGTDSGIIINGQFKVKIQ